MTKRRVIALVGLSGIGKSTLLEDARRRIPFEHLQASDLIKWERQERQGRPVAHDLLREGDIDDNQALLVSGFHRYASREGLVVLDGHAVIDTPNGLVEIPPWVFAEIGVSRFLILIDDAEKIESRRSSDSRRSRPPRSPEELSMHQERSILSIYRAALALRVPVNIVPLNGLIDIVVYFGE